MRLTLREVIRYQHGLRPAADAVATAVSEAEGGVIGRVFLPGVLPCGECALCRRALVGACPVRRQLDLQAGIGSEVTVPDRFITPLDGVAGVEPLADDVAVLAGVVAAALSAMAMAGAGPGDEALWLGDDAIGAAGTDLARARGLKSFQFRSDGSPLAEAHPLESPATESAHLRSQQLLFITVPEKAALDSAATMARPGSTLLVLAEGPFTLASLSLPADARLILQGGAHPDLVPEALAALARGEVSAARLSQRLAGS